MKGMAAEKAARGKVQTTNSSVEGKSLYGIL
jgi:hypothetical protein